MAESISEGTLSQFLKAVGEHVEMDEEIATIETDKIDVSVNAPKAGVLTKLLVQEGDVVTLEQGLAVLDTDGTPSPDVQSKPFASSVAPHEGEKSPPTTEGSALNATQNANFVSTSQATVPPPTPKKQENVVTAPAPSQSIQRVASPAYSTSDGRPKPPRLEQVVSQASNILYFCHFGATYSDTTVKIGKTLSNAKDDRDSPQGISEQVRIPDDSPESGHERTDGLARKI